ncbi:MAG: LytTR family DNA-binding domain-containing protein [Bacteroidota bacterium]
MNTIILVNTPDQLKALRALQEGTNIVGQNILIVNTLEEALRFTQHQSINRSPRLALATTEGYFFLNIEDIVHCKADGRYTVFHLVGQGRYTTAKNLGEFEVLLQSFNFLRVHRSQIINLNKIKKYIKGRPVRLVLEDNTQVMVSNAYREELLKRLDLGA